MVKANHSGALFHGSLSSPREGQALNKRYTLKVYPKGLGREVYRVIEISGKDTLDDLCGVILEAFDYIDEHLYEFNMDNRIYGSTWSYQLEPRYGNEPSTAIEIGQLSLTKAQKFSLHYDFGNDWMFTITVQKISDETKRKPSIIIKEKGTLIQYPSWDEAVL